MTDRLFIIEKAEGTVGRVFRDGHLGTRMGQVPRRDAQVERAAVMKLVNQKPPKWSVDRFLDRPVFTPRGVVRDLGLDVAVESDWVRFISTVVNASEREHIMRRQIMERMKQEDWPPEQRKALFDRAVSYYRNRNVKKSEGAVPAEVVRVVSVDDLHKASPRGGAYHRRVKQKGGGWKYYYDEDTYNKSPDAHHSGEDMIRLAMSGNLIQAVTAAGEKGVAPKDLKMLVRKYGAKRVTGCLRKECEDGGKVLFKEGRFYPRPDEKAPKKEEKVEKAMLYIGPRGGKWADPKHTIPFKEGKQKERAKAQLVPKKVASQLESLVKKGMLKKQSVAEHVEEAKQVQARHQKKLKSTLATLKSLSPSDAKVKGRVKKTESIIGKLVRKPKNYNSASDLQDVTGMRIVLGSTKDVYETVGKIKAQFNVVEEEDKIASPQGDLKYRSVHLIIRDETGDKELQVRTRRQDVVADWCHDLYKPVNPKQEAALQKHGSQLITYAAQVSDHAASLDRGENPPDPPNPGCPKFVAQAFGCPDL